ncbi:ATP-binding protein [Corynebacterium breve]|uniref:ATP-binding protein n=1 Tax=Corynebacterium breve TaxID=3049799 RepID=A0ABY8VHA0_9CORY|nr:ATP-binding protein [Corynebacterium breve]WIM68712.1 ATP-binding protein [Corynebacterium breve]
MNGDSLLLVTKSVLKSLLEVSSGGERITVKTREGTQKEFKESFSFGALPLYLRTMAAFANAKGGYIIFGVTDNPRSLKGLEGSHLDQFDNLDRAKLTDGLNEYFSPEIRWEAETFKLEGRTLGVIYVAESENKPGVTKKHSIPESRLCKRATFFIGIILARRKLSTRSSIGLLQNQGNENLSYCLNSFGT